MSFFEGLNFFTYLIAALSGAAVLGILEKPLRHYAFLLSVLFITAVFWSKPQQFLYLLIYVLLQIVLVKGYLAIRKRYGRKAGIYHIFLVLSIAPLLINKIGGLFHLSVLGFLGISYLPFRAVQMIIEIYDGVIEEVPAVEFLSFLLFFPSISSGPIDRSRRFHEDYEKVYTRQEYLELLGDGLMKIMLGLVYKIVLAALFAKWMEAVAYGETWYAGIGYVYCYGFNMFFDFAGYSLMAVGTSYILGVKAPDNFRLPFISKDIKEFWDRWHISLSHWFRDFIFSRFIMTAIRKKWFKTRLTGASIGFIINMLVMGAWHGLTVSYLLYGLYHGVLLALTEIYQKKARFYKKYKKKKWYQAVSCFVTFQLVMFGFYIFSGRMIETVAGFIK